MSVEILVNGRWMARFKARSLGKRSNAWRIFRQYARAFHDSEVVLLVDGHEKFRLHKPAAFHDNSAQYKFRYTI